MNFRIPACPLALVLLALGTSCATIVGDPNQVLPIRSTPSEASIQIRDEAGAETFRGVTPATVTLPKSTGKYWGKKSYKVTLEKPGFKPREYELTAHPNGWYLGGNWVFGGLVGWFLVDPFTGKMYKIAPDAIDAALDADAAGGAAAPPARSAADPQSAPAGPAAELLPAEPAPAAQALPEPMPGTEAVPETQGS